MDHTLIEQIRTQAHPFGGTPADDAPLLNLIGNARFVLIGEASHGTHEFYHERARLTQRLIMEHGFNAVVVEADWPDAYRVNCYVQGAGTDDSPEAALGDFGRFPTWMWRNTVVRDFVAWLRAYNATRATGTPPVGFYGMDLYSLRSSLEAVVRYLEQTDPQAAQRARERYACFDHVGRDPQHYGYVASAGAETCEDAVIEQLRELQQHAAEIASNEGDSNEEVHFFVEQNARLVKNAEAYYRSMFRGRVSSWNLRDQHMAETIDALVAHRERQGEHARFVVWAHNSHLGDARATEMGQSGELNVGQLVRERYRQDAVLIGFSTYAGSVAAASDWDMPPEHKRVRPGLADSYEALLHSVGMPRLLLILRNNPTLSSALHTPRLQRAIGVIYRPETERMSHYFSAHLPTQFDALIHLDQTVAVTPLEHSSGWESNATPETFPTGV